jgi:hypothetical protein
MCDAYVQDVCADQDATAFAVFQLAVACLNLEHHQETLPVLGVLPLTCLDGTCPVRLPSDVPFPFA